MPRSLMYGEEIGLTSAGRRGNEQLGQGFAIKLPAVMRVLEAAQKAVNGGVCEASVGPPSVPQGAIFKANVKLTRATRGREAEAGSRGNFSREWNGRGDIY